MNVTCQPTNGRVTTLCRMCETRCAVDVHIHDNILTDITPYKEHPVNQGRMCPRGGAALDLFYHPDRILTPLKRKANGDFQPIAYERALDEIAEKLIALKRKDGAKSVGVWKGEGLGFNQQEGFARRFTHAFGSPNYFSNDSVCYNGRYLGYHLVCGFWNVYPEFDKAKLILLFGTNPPMCHPPFMRQLADAKENGAALVMIDPRLNPVACHADIYAKPIPGSDGVLGWGLIRYLIETKCYDAGLVEKKVVGFDKIAAYAERFTPEYVERQSGIYSHVVTDIAELIIKNRPDIAMFAGAGLEHNENGVNNVRTLVILACLAGALGQPGGIFNPEPPDIRPLSTTEKWPVKGHRPIGADTYPVLYDFCKECHTITAMDYMLGKRAYPLKGLLMAAANPVVTNPDAAKVERALSGLDLLVVNDFFLTKTARLADYVIPAATFLEQEELYCHTHLQRLNVTRKVAAVEGIYEVYRFWRELAQRLGFVDTSFPWDTEHDVNNWQLEPLEMTVEKLSRFPEGYPYKPLRYDRCLTNPLPTPSGKVEFASAYLKGLGLDEISEYHPPYHIRHQDEAYPFVLTTGARKSLFYHSRHMNIARFRTIHPRALVEMHPDDAASLGISNGDKVRIQSRVGMIVLHASVRHPAEMLRGVVEIYHGWENAPVNLLTPDDVNDPISGLPLLKGVPVHIEKLKDDDPRSVDSLSSGHRK